MQQFTHRPTMIRQPCCPRRGASFLIDRRQDRVVAPASLVTGAMSAVWAPGRRPRIVFSFTIRHGKIVAIPILADPARLGQLDLAILTD